jgi:fatty-acyl-CoA synthase
LLWLKAAAGGDGMQGLMQYWPLNVNAFLEHGARWNPDRELVTRTPSGELRRSNYREAERRARRISKALLAAGIKPGDRVATMAWNSQRHLECWYGITGIGAVCHTVNPQLFIEQVRYIVNHARDRILFADPGCAEFLARLLPDCPTIEKLVFLCDGDELPDIGFPAVALETWIADHSSDVAWGGVDETSACGLCYTSGTTGNPKGVLYSHRSNALHTLTSLQASVLGFTSRDTILLMTPLYHANGWGQVYSAPMAGAKLVFPGRQLDGKTLYELMEGEGVTYSAGVPTFWQMIFQHMREHGLRFSTLKRVTLGGSSTSRSLYDEFLRHGIEFCQGWGMTEAGPAATVASTTPEVLALPEDERPRHMLTAGRLIFGLEMKVIDDDGDIVPQDGATPGLLRVRGHTVASEYYGGDVPSPLDDDGYLDTGDVVTVDPLGFIRITDRAKDLIKSGGEWISSIDVENVAASHPKIALSGVIGIAHPKYQERPIIVVQLRPGTTMTKEEVLGHLRDKLVKWWLPDAVEFIDQMPLGPTGKVDKKVLRATFNGYRLEAAAPESL